MKVKMESEKVGLKVNIQKTQIMANDLSDPVPSLHGKQMGKQWKQWLTLFFWAPKSLKMVIAAMKLKDTYSLEGKPRQHIKKQRHYFVNKGPSGQGYGFSCGHVWM